MSQLYLPAAHTEEDLVLAGLISGQMESAELYVAWTPAQGQAAPEVAAMLRDPAPHWTDTLALVFQVVREMWTAFLGRESATCRIAPGAPTGELPAARERKPAAGEAAA